MNIFDYACETFESYFDVQLNEKAKEHIEALTKIYGQDEVETAIYYACEEYNDAAYAFEKIGGILYNRKRRRNRYFVG